MGFFDKIKKKIKDVAKGVTETIGRGFTGIDRRLGGVLPGGAPVSPKVKETVSKIGGAIKDVGRTALKVGRGKDIQIGGRTIPTGLGEIENLQTGTLPIGPGGAAAGVKAISSGASAVKAFFGGTNKVNKARSVANTAKVFGKSEAQVQKIVDKALLSKEVSKIVAKESAPKFAGKIAKWAVGGVAGADILVSWYALDNVITGQKFFLVDLLKGLKAGTVTPNAAAEAIEDSQQTRDKARSFVNLSTRINPLLWPFRNLIMTGVEADDAAAELKIAEIEALAEQVESEETAEPGLTSQEQFEENQASIASAREEANEAFSRRREEGKEEDEATFRERTLLFEAIRKRNAGVQLTPEEIALLEKFGLSSKQIQRADTGRSALGFGLLR